MKIINKFLQEANDQVTIYQDLDGVLTDFDGAVKKMGYGSVDSLVERGGEGLLFGMIGKQGSNFWSQMEWTKDGKKLWNYVKNYNVKILSAPTQNPTSIKGKNLWIDKNLGKNVERILVPAKKKKEYANQNAILIDDRESNVNEWRLAGGKAILHTDAESTIKKLKEMI